MSNLTAIAFGVLDAAEDDATRQAVITRRLDPEIHPADLAWWVAEQERGEIRAELSNRGLL